MRLPPKVYQFLVCCFAAIGSFTYGYDLAIISQVEASESFIAKFNPTTNEKGAVVSLFTGGCFFGAFGASFIADRWGRRVVLFSAAIIFMVGGCLQGGARNLNYLFGGRFIAGFGVGNLTMIIPLYQAEIANPSIRGMVTALQQFFLGIGSLCSSWIGYGCYLGFSDKKQYMVPLFLQIVPAGVLASMIFLFPESPRFLIMKGKLDEGLKTIARLHANGDTEDPFVVVEFDQILTEVEMEKKLNSTWLDLFNTRDRFRRIIICVALQASVQLTGVSAIQYYSPTIFANIGLSTGRTLLYQSINSIIALIAQGICVLTIDLTGRRWALILCNIGSCLMFMIGAILLAQFPAATNNSRPAQIGFIATTWIYNFIFSWGIGPLSWVIPAESFSLAIRSKGVSLATMTSYAFNTMIGQVTDKAMNSVGWKYYLLFIICSFTNAIFFYCFLPETKGTPLELMDKLWQEVPIFVPSMKEKHTDFLKQFEEEVQQVEEKGTVDHLEDIEKVNSNNTEV
ncbi:hypothetical protein CANARDRAFT_27184 [[Candida] arabinofermentans NRRL YB-2248]|uniref:Major facilitator superfamily (MFS) profile domain-containing protein n=1 Tax=[Candida] arabinofermentans NRRL YB-2248 TaxID=983967 RepID=A0A1E4T4X8_9ASCO|nr:hypothetical protein CANARDRAFT_27184 [[Candida] arabinofermentans NRRL YB-2248]